MALSKPVPKRGNGQGSVRQLPSKKWRWEIMVGGNRYGGTASSKTLAQQALAQQIADASRGGVVDPSTETVEQYLTRWLEGKRVSRSERTHNLQADLLRRHIIPVFGEVKLQKLAPVDIKRLFDQLNKKGLGQSSQRQVHQFLKSALREAVQLELLIRNVAEVVKPDPPRDRERDVLAAFTPDEAKAFMNAAKADHRGNIFVFILSTGVRRGEACGLRWSDIDWANQKARIVENVVSEKGERRITTPKTSGSRRVVFLSPAVMLLLNQHKLHRDQQVQLLGSKWQNAEQVFVNSLGGICTLMISSEICRVSVTLLGLGDCQFMGCATPMHL